MNVPSGMSFSGGFTFCAWVNFNRITHYARIIDFGNGAGRDNAIMMIHDDTSEFKVNIWAGSSTSMFYLYSHPFTLNTWNHVVCVVQSRTTVYLHCMAFILLLKLCHIHSLSQDI